MTTSFAWSAVWIAFDHASAGEPHSVTVGSPSLGISSNTAPVGASFAINSAFLFGIDYFLHSSDFNNTLNLKVLYKQFIGMDSKLPMQFTAVWGCQDLFGLPKLRFSGFVDVWWEGDKTVVLSEPQLWMGIGSHANIGGEVEFSYNFGGLEATTGKAFNIMPCLGWKWVF